MSKVLTYRNLLRDRKCLLQMSSLNKDEIPKIWNKKRREGKLKNSSSKHKQMIEKFKENNNAPYSFYLNCTYPDRIKLSHYYGMLTKYMAGYMEFFEWVKTHYDNLTLRMKIRKTKKLTGIQIYFESREMIRHSLLEIYEENL